MNSSQLADIRSEWSLRADTIYLNHGSFGPPPRAVRQARAKWQVLLDEQPMDFYVRRWDAVFDDVLTRLGQFVGTARENLCAVDNATLGMNIIAYGFPLQAGEKILLTDHEYGTVKQTWQRKCDEVGGELNVVSLPFPLEDEQQVVDAIVTALDDETRLLVVSHITSPTGVVLPIQPICAAARERGVAVCIDGPHALLQVPIHLDRFDCDFYVASGHKWLSAPFGSGFLYVHPRQQAAIQSPIVSWGRQPPRQAWEDPFVWWGTRDPSPNLTMGDAIDVMKGFGIEPFRQHSYSMALAARESIREHFPLPGLLTDAPRWQASMALAPLPAGDGPALQRALWERFHIEVPIIEWKERRWVRVSCHWYNESSQVDQLVDALRELLKD